MGGRLDYVIGYNLVDSNVKAKVISDYLVSDHYAILTEYTVADVKCEPHPKLRINISDNLKQMVCWIYTWVSG